MPKDNIERAIKKAAGGDDSFATDYEDEDYVAVWALFRRVLTRVGLVGHLGGVTDDKNFSAGIQNEFVRWIVEKPHASFVERGDAYLGD